MRIQPYLFFEGRCEEAVEFYRSVLGAEATMLMRFKGRCDLHAPGMIPPGAEDKVMHMIKAALMFLIMCVTPRTFRR